MNVGLLIKGLRESQGRLQRFVARDAGIAADVLSKIEMNRREIKMSEYLSIMKALGLQPGDYLGHSNGAPDTIADHVGLILQLTPAGKEKALKMLKIILELDQLGGNSRRN